MSDQSKSTHTLLNTTTRGLVLEQVSGGVTKTIPLIDLVPPEAVGKFGTYKITIEFEEKGKES
ncbi:MAG TPA: hypothetical protein VM577_05445 [Anaerovoracaceae bacterium]|nr:hypothetical protein [Anaerovoracaceae bacterium]